MWFCWGFCQIELHIKNLQKHISGRCCVLGGWRIVFSVWCLQWLPSHASDFISNAGTVLKLSANKTRLKDGKLAKKRMLKEVTPCAKLSDVSKTRCLRFEGNYWATTMPLLILQSVQTIRQQSCYNKFNSREEKHSKVSTIGRRWWWYRMLIMIWNYEKWKGSSSLCM